MKLKRAAFDPVDAIEDVAALLSSAAADKDIELMVRSGPGVPQMVIGDAGRFRQIITNLVGNAVKFTEKGHILIEITAESDGGDGVMLSLRVEDHPASASPRTSWPRCSRNSRRSIPPRPGGTKAPVSAWRSPPGSSACSGRLHRGGKRA